MEHHISLHEWLVCFAGIFVFWYYRFSSAKDIHEKEKGKKLTTNEMIKEWFHYKWNNILGHVIISSFCLYIGEANLRDLFGDLATQLPETANEIGSSAMIGFFGSFISEGLQKIVSLIKEK